jgi:hypothetical protein
MFKAGALIFLILAFDEVFMIHENNLWNIFNLEILNYSGASWMFIYLGIAIIAGLAFLPSGLIFLKLYPRIAITIAVGTGVAVFGAIGIEILGVGYLYPEVEVSTVSNFRIFYIAGVCIEEFCEMLGMSIILYSLLEYAREENLVTCFK